MYVGSGASILAGVGAPNLELLVWLGKGTSFTSVCVDMEPWKEGGGSVEKLEKVCE